MFKTDRRGFIKLSGGVLAAGAAAGAFTGTLATPHVARAAGGKVVVVGGGPAGATTARYLKAANPAIDVTLIEANTTYHTCFMSNEVLGGDRSMEQIAVGFDGLKAAGVTVVHDLVTGVDTGAKTVTTKGGQSFGYDRLVVAPGIDFKWETIDGYDAQVAEDIPHAWKAGPQTATLRKQLEAMPDGGLFVLSAPPNPFRCPPGPYERVSLVANYFKKHKPKSKIIILDAKDAFSKKGLFEQAWTKFYGYGTDNSMIEWVPAAQQGKVIAVDAGERAAKTDFETYKADVLNIIPAQKAGKLAFDMGLVDGEWAPVNKKTFESTIHKDVHVLGDASIATKMPKSGYSANSQAKNTARAIAALMAGKEAPTPSYINTCYSIAGDDHAFSVAAVYRYNEAENVIAGVEGAGGLSPMDASDADRKREVTYAHSWYNNVVDDSWGPGAQARS